MVQVNYYLINSSDFMLKIKQLIRNKYLTFNFVRMIEWKKLQNYLNPKKKECILDVACGNGSLTIKIASTGCNMFGMDISEKAITEAKILATEFGLQINFDVGNAENLPYPTNFFDKVISSCALEHFDNDVEALKEISRVLKPKGVFVLSVDSFSYPINRNIKEMHKKMHHVNNYYNQSNLSEKLEKNSLKITKSEYLFNSRLTSFFFRITNINNSLPVFLYYIVSLIAYPLSTASDKLFGDNDRGFTLIVKGVNNKKKEFHDE